MSTSEYTPPLLPEAAAPTGRPIAADPHTKERRALCAAYCVCCGRALADAVSAATGVGPVCRKRLGLTDAIAHRLAANELMARLCEADVDGEAAECLKIIAQIRALDPAYGRLADRVEERWLKGQKFLVIQSTTPGRVGIKTPYEPAFVNYCREQRFRWDPDKKVWTFLSSQTPAVVDKVDVIYGANVLSTDLRVVPPSRGDQ